jgi:hypothetical protein
VVSKELFMRRIRPCLILVAASGIAFGADQALLQLVPPEAPAVAGIQLERNRNTPLGQYLLLHLGERQEQMAKLYVESGFDPRRDVSEIVLAMGIPDEVPAATAPAGQAKTLILARGSFDPARIEAAVVAHGGALSVFQGTHLLLQSSGEHPGQDLTGALAFLDSSIAVIGDPALVKQAIVRRASGDPAGAWCVKAQALSTENDAWFLVQGPVSELTSGMPGSTAGTAGQTAQMFQSVTAASGGMKLGANVVITAEVVARSEKDAQSLAEVLRFLAAMLEANKAKSPAAGQISALLSSLRLTTSTNVIHLSLTASESQVEALLAVLQQHPAGAAAAPPPPAN